MIAAYNKDFDVVKNLIAGEIDVNLQNKSKVSFKSRFATFTFLIPTFLTYTSCKIIFAKLYKKLSFFCFYLRESI